MCRLMRDPQREAMCYKRLITDKRKCWQLNCSCWQCALVQVQQALQISAQLAETETMVVPGDDNSFL